MVIVDIHLTFSISKYVKSWVIKKLAVGSENVDVIVSIISISTGLLILHVTSGDISNCIFYHICSRNRQECTHIYDEKRGVTTQ